MQANPTNLLVHGDNLEAMRRILPKHRGAVDAIYIDPPYNTGSSLFQYRDSYKGGSWEEMMLERLKLARLLAKETGFIAASINESELFRLHALLCRTWGEENYLSTLTVKVRHEDRILKGHKHIHEVTEFVLLFRASERAATGRRRRAWDDSGYAWRVEAGEVAEELELGGRKVKRYAPGSYRLEKVPAGLKGLKRISIRGSLREGNNSGRFYVRELEPMGAARGGHLFQVEGMGADGLGHRWFWLPDRKSGRKNGDYFQGVPLGRKEQKELPYPNLFDFTEAFNKAGKEGGVAFRNGKKPVAFLVKVLSICGIADNREALVLDFFAGSGSTGHAVMEMNAQDGGRRSFVLAEKGDHFDSVLLPRIENCRLETGQALPLEIIRL
jgi:adenine-specific DNA-methyltransferase